MAWEVCFGDRELSSPPSHPLTLLPALKVGCKTGPCSGLTSKASQSNAHPHRTQLLSPPGRPCPSPSNTSAHRCDVCNLGFSGFGRGTWASRPLLPVALDDPGEGGWSKAPKGLTSSLSGAWRRGQSFWSLADRDWHSSSAASHLLGDLGSVPSPL